jgi:hypothetical protein
MHENTIVTLPLEDFDALREADKEHKRLVSSIAACFKYSCARNPLGYTEILTVDIERLIKTTKYYSLWGKDVETDLDKITITPKAEAEAEA